jgi:hypothetical protein
VDEFMASLLQARADWEAAELLANEEISYSYCRAIAKWQQTVEKPIKAIVACLRDAGILHIDIGYQHGVERFVSVLIRLPHVTDNRSIQQQLHGFLDQHTRAGIRALDALVPRRPAVGHGPRRNTEYPGGVASDLEDRAAEGRLDEAQPLVARLVPMAEELMRLVNGLSLETLRQQDASPGAESVPEAPRPRTRGTRGLATADGPGLVVQVVIHRRRQGEQDLLLFGIERVGETRDAIDIGDGSEERSGDLMGVVRLSDLVQP